MVEGGAGLMATDKQFIRADNLSTTTPNVQQVPRLHYCGYKRSNLCKPRCKECFWFSRGCKHPNPKPQNRKNKNSPACAYWNMPYFSQYKTRSSKEYHRKIIAKAIIEGKEWAQRYKVAAFIQPYLEALRDD